MKLQLPKNLLTDPVETHTGIHSVPQPDGQSQDSIPLDTNQLDPILIEDATADYIGLGVAAGSFANLLLTLFQID